MANSSMKDFDLIKSPLEGINLIEASAGSGKTHAISRIFIRLLLEKEITISQILVVTFTEAATEELRHRIRNDLQKAITALSQPLPAVQSDSFFRDMLLKALDFQESSELVPDDPLVNKKRKHLLERLVVAMRSFDETCIYTIHGFCRKVLKENAFESSALFDTELITDQSILIQNILDDFWRSHIVDASLLFLDFLIKKKLDQSYFYKVLASNVTKPFLTIVPEFESQKQDTTSLENEFTQLFQAVALLWSGEKKKISDCLFLFQGLHKNKYNEKNLSELFKSCDYFFTTGSLHRTPYLFKDFEKLTVSSLTRATKVQYQPPEHPFFALCEQLYQIAQQLIQAFETRLIGLEISAYNYILEQLTARKRQKNVQFFHDLLMNLYNAMQQKGQRQLVNSLLIKYKAILIDEFQDTDQIQYNIFSRLYAPASHSYFLIGDPKQAIYSFRGADIYTYLQVSKKDAGKNGIRMHTLSSNWRSEDELIRAVNSLFSNRKQPFLLNEIVFHPAVMASQTQVPSFIYRTNQTEADSKKAAGFIFWVMDAPQRNPEQTAFKKVTGTPTAGTVIPKSLATKWAIQAVVGEIGKLLQNQNLRLGDTRLKPNDLAILVRKNHQALQMQQALRESGIPSVLYSMESIFTSHEALELVRLLLAIEEPGNEYLLKSALVTDYFGLTGNELDKLLHDESGWEDWLKEFRQYHFIWHKEGFFKMMRTIISVHEVRIRLLSFADGERRLTNLLHLTELLHQSALENNLDMAGLIKWYSNQLLGNDEQKTEHQIRLETDENTVRIITIHKSKGLQYPIVFCPFLWDMPLDKKENFTFHDEHYNLVLELGSEKKEVHKLLADREELAENLRLLYVALTRARNRCYVIWGNINLAENSGLAYLLHPVEEETIIDPSLQEESIWSKLKLLTTKDIYSTLQSLAEQSAGAIQVKALPFFTPAQTRFQPGEQKEQLIYRSFTSSIDSTFRLTSFSTLTHQSATAPDSTDSVSEDHDANIRHFFPAYSFLLRNKTNAVDKVAEEDSLFTFPGGTKTGTFIHAIMEKVDFQEQNDPVLYDLIDHELNFFGFENKWREVIFTMVKQLTTVVLDGKELSLAKISKGETSREMEFFFPLKPVDVKGLAKLFEQLIPVNHGPELEYFTRLPEKIKKLHFSPVKGFMRGFIDLIFVYRGKYYLLDWKSNLLGRSREDYSYDELRNVMIEDYYFLQSYLYALALHKYLAQRIEGYQYQKHFGGIYYIFVRGVSMDKNSVRTDTGSQSGIYFDLPPEKLISNLENYLLAEP